MEIIKYIKCNKNNEILYKIRKNNPEIIKKQISQFLKISFYIIQISFKSISEIKKIISTISIT